MYAAAPPPRRPRLPACLRALLRSRPLLSRGLVRGFAIDRTSFRVGESDGAESNVGFSVAMKSVRDCLQEMGLSQPESFKETREQVDEVIVTLQESKYTVFYEEGNPLVSLKRDFPEGRVELNFNASEGDLDFGEEPVDPILLNYTLTIRPNKSKQYAMIKACSSIFGETRISSAEVVNEKDQTAIPSPDILKLDSNVHQGFVDMLTYFGMTRDWLSDVVHLAKNCYQIESNLWSSEWESFTKSS